MKSLWVNRFDYTRFLFLVMHFVSNKNSVYQYDLIALVH